MGKSWATDQTDEFEAWLDSLGDRDQTKVLAAIEVLVAEGPTLGRPLADRISGSRHANMKELRPLGGHLRILFAFDPRRTAILLIGGDKEGRWNRWYKEAIPLADALFDRHLAGLENEGKPR